MQSRHRAPSQSLDSPQSRENHRRRRPKARTSCMSCQQRKARCDLVTAGGCHRCRVLSLRCSIIESRPTSEAGQTAPISPVTLSHKDNGSLHPEQTECSTSDAHLVRDMDRRIKEVLGMTTVLAHSLRPGGTGLGRNVARRVRKGKENEPSSLSGAAHVGYALLQDERWVLNDPVEAGVITEQSLEEYLST